MGGARGTRRTSWSTRSARSSGRIATSCRCWPGPARRGSAVSSQGLADLARIDRALPQQVVQNVAVRVMLRQSSYEDARAWAEHAGEYEREDVSRRLERGWGGDKDTGLSST